ncbi:hypothetical protein C0V97_03470 [Asaia sp. W19]|uniref:putative bifunctional diguanylate cyclase/phosphodiesterase n=1 Tax=unclassified Asaia TaxID=2685023 RepID=UPI000F8C3820|nr:bifunctional diguanylate cyclase/phosphodiesterase [Asaia sp. W19]RUT27273.1 hypothetical protein C0V97_03470 [Asaia sp. W19]
MPSLPGRILDTLPLLVCHVEPDGRVSYLNHCWRSFSGLCETAGTLSWTDLIGEGEGQLPCRCPEPMAYCLHEAVSLHHPGRGDIRARLHWQKMDPATGGWLLYCSPETDMQAGSRKDHTLGVLAKRPDGEEPGLMRAASSLTEPGRSEAEARLQQTASFLREPADHPAGLASEPENGRDDGQAHDALTGLPDRAAFDRQAALLLFEKGALDERVGLLLLDIDYLGDINTLYGRETGDRILCIVAECLSDIVAGRGIVARSGDDEFAALLTGIGRDENLADLAQALLAATDHPVAIGAQQITFGLSIGAALFPRDGRVLSRLYQGAQIAMGDVKAHGRGGFRLFDPTTMKPEGGVSAQANVVRQMLSDDLVYPAYQAKVRLTDGQLMGAEALMRWRGRGDLHCGPDSFPEIFRNYDLASRVSARVQERVFEDIALWRRTGLMPPPISINVAPVEFMQDDYAEKLLARLERFGLSARMIELELTEHVLYQNSEHYIHRALAQLQRAGIRIILDDFGTGYSSLGFLRDFPVSCIKIDRSFIRRICAEPSMEVIVEAIIRFGEAISVDVVAEGIETDDQLALLRRINCPTGQGYHFSTPIDSTAFARLLTGSRRFPV